MKIQIQIMSTIPRGVFFAEKFFDNEESRLFHYRKEGSKEGHEVIPTTISGKQQKSNQNFGFNLIAFFVNLDRFCHDKNRVNFFINYLIISIYPL
jgi:hypothetical protein